MFPDFMAILYNVIKYLMKMFILNHIIALLPSKNQKKFVNIHKIKTKYYKSNIITYRSTITPLAFVNHFWSHVL
jgi:hypothetical protein